MAQAFVLINCELGSEEQIISELKTFPDIKEVRGTFGAYDIIAKVSSDSIEKPWTPNKRKQEKPIIH